MLYGNCTATKSSSCEKQMRYPKLGSRSPSELKYRGRGIRNLLPMWPPCRFSLWGVTVKHCCIRDLPEFFACPSLPILPPTKDCIPTEIDEAAFANPGLEGIALALRLVLSCVIHHDPENCTSERDRTTARLGIPSGAEQVCCILEPTLLNRVPKRNFRLDHRRIFGFNPSLS